MPANADARDALVNRQLPEMQLSDGSASSMTGPPPPAPHYLNAEGRARYRFAVEGNAIRKCRYTHSGLMQWWADSCSHGRRWNSGARRRSRSSRTWCERRGALRHQPGTRRRADPKVARGFPEPEGRCQESGRDCSREHQLCCEGDCRRAWKCRHSCMLRWRRGMHPRAGDVTRRMAPSHGHKLYRCFPLRASCCEVGCNWPKLDQLLTIR